ncbi:MAG: sugar phosphate isomerase/epimerase family protein [Thermoguttaceae bacterium]
MASNLKRRDFLKISSAALAGAAVGGSRIAVAAGKTEVCSPSAEAMGWRLGMSQYTFRRFCLYEALEMTAGLGIRNIEPAFFLALDKARPDLKVNEDLSPEVRKELKQRLADTGVAISAFYSNLDTDADRAKKIFDFCKEMNILAIVAEPKAEALDMIEKLCDEYKIDLAIHNHPRNPQSPDYTNWKPENVLALCTSRGPRIGACCDTGHWVRSGLDPVACLKVMEGRIRGFHLKDVAEEGDPAARDMPLGEGKADYAAVLADLKRQGYRGVMTIEYEHDSPQLIEDVGRCAAFVETMAKKLG